MDHANIKTSTYRALINPTVSDQVVGQAQGVLDQGAGGNQPHKELYNARVDQNDDLTRVAAGLKA